MPVNPLVPSTTRSTGLLLSWCIIEGVAAILCPLALPLLLDERFTNLLKLSNAIDDKDIRAVTLVIHYHL